MCDIWRANANRREMSVQELAGHRDALRRLRVRRVMLTGGEPLLHRNLWALCDLLRAERIRITLVTTGLLIERHAAAIARAVDDLVISLDGPREVHDAVRRVPGGFDRIAAGMNRLAGGATVPRTTARSVVQRANHAFVAATIGAAREIGFDRISFLAADVSSTAFNREEPWTESRRAEVAVSADDLPRFAEAIRQVEEARAGDLADGFVAGGIESLWRIHRYYRALAGLDEFPPVRCNAPWVSAVLEPGGRLRPCFFHDPYPAAAQASLRDALNAPAARAFRCGLDVSANETCRRCVCSLSLPVFAQP